MVKPSNAQAITTPTIPEFTAKLTISSLEVTINNQQLTGSQNINDESHLYYGFRFKDPNSMLGNWEYDPIYFVGTSSYGTYYAASASNYTVISFPVDDYPFDGINHHTGISKNGPVEIQVMALIGIEIPTTEQNGTVYQFEGETSDWSGAKTITIGEESSTLNPSPTQSNISVSPSPPIGTINTGPHTEPFPIETVLLVFSILTVVVIVSLLLYIGHLKRSVTKPDNSTV